MRLREIEKETRIADLKTWAADGEKIGITHTLAVTGGNIKAAARILGVNRVTIWRKMKEYKIRKPRKNRPARRPAWG